MTAKTISQDSTPAMSPRTSETGDQPHLTGVLHHTAKNYSCEVSNKAGYLCRIHLTATFDMPPDVVHAIFTYPDNSSLFRDIKRVGGRKVIKVSPGLKELEVEQLGELKIMMMHRAYSTWMKVLEDTRDPECLITQFDLLRSDMLSRFSGRWELRPIKDAATGKVTGTSSVLTQDVLPKGVPTFLTKVPILGDMLRGVTLRAIQRLIEDINTAILKVKRGMAGGAGVQEVLRGLCGTYAEEMHANGTVESFAFEASDDEAWSEAHSNATGSRRVSEMGRPSDYGAGATAGAPVGGSSAAAAAGTQLRSPRVSMSSMGHAAVAGGVLDSLFAVGGPVATPVYVAAAAPPVEAVEGQIRRMSLQGH